MWAGVGPQKTGRMSPIQPTSRAVAALIVCLLTIGLWQVGEGSWIYAKARLAQLLLQRAWSRTLAGEAHVKPWPWADTWPIARLVVPSHGIDQIVLEGAYGRTLAFGPGHLESSAFPGSTGTTILTGHRDTHFRFLQQLQEGNELTVQASSGRSYRYRVHDRSIVSATSSGITMRTDRADLVLVNCYPFDGIRTSPSQRYVVTAGMEEEEAE
jgi:sortase A